jgi:hypothetical protein
MMMSAFATSSLQDGDEAGFFCCRERGAGLPVRAQHLLIAGDMANLEGGGPVVDRQKRGGQVWLCGHQSGDRLTGAVVADNRDKRCRGAERGNVAHHVSGTAQHLRLALYPEDRDGRFRRNPFDRSIDEVIQHDIADAQHACGAEP